MNNPSCKECGTVLTFLVPVPRDPQLEGAGPDLVWGCTECNIRYDVFLADDPYKEDDFVAIIRDSYYPEPDPE